MGTMEDIKNNTYKTSKLLEKSLELDVKPRNWHDSHTLTPTTEQRYNVFKNLGKQGGRYLRIKTSKACAIKVTLAGVNQMEKIDEGLKANKVGKFRFKAPMLLTDFYITPTIADTVVTWWVSTVELPIDLEDDMTHLDGDTFESVSDRAVLIAGQDGTNIRAIEVDSAGKMKFASMDNNQNFGIRVGGFLPQSQEYGDAWYCDGNLAASGDGDEWSEAVLTIAELDALITTNNGDYAFVAKKVTAYNENVSVNGVNITKHTCTYVGMGGNSCNVQNDNASAAYIFNITGDGVEVAGFQSTEITSTVEGFYCSGDYCYFHRIILDGAMENGFHLHNVAGGTIEWCRIKNCTNDGIELSGITTETHILHNSVYSVGDTAIYLNGDYVDDNFIKYNTIIGGAGTTTYGIAITSGDNNFIDWNSMGELGTQPVLNTGSNNYFGPNNSADSISGSYNRTVANGTSLIATNVTNIDLWASGKYEFQWDLSAMVSAGEGGSVDTFIYSKVITAFIRRDMDRMVIGTDNLHPTCEKGFVGGDSQLQEGLQCSVAVTANRSVGWRIVKTS